MREAREQEERSSPYYKERRVVYTSDGTIANPNKYNNNFNRNKKKSENDDRAALVITVMCLVLGFAFLLIGVMILHWGLMITGAVLFMGVIICAQFAGGGGHVIITTTGTTFT
jgi:uncharacterized membrane protein